MGQAGKQLDIPAFVARHVSRDRYAQSVIVARNTDKNGRAADVQGLNRSLQPQNPQNGIDPTGSHGHFVERDLIILPPLA